MWDLREGPTLGPGKEKRKKGQSAVWSWVVLSKLSNCQCKRLFNSLETCDLNNFLKICKLLKPAHRSYYTIRVNEGIILFFNIIQPAG